MWILAFILDPGVIARVLRHIGEETGPGESWAEVDQTGGWSDEV